MAYRFFKCNVLGGFRLSDINRNVKQDDYIYVEDQICSTSRAIRAAVDKNWMTEVTEQEASQFLSIPRQVSVAGVQQTEIGPKRNIASSSQVATPNARITNEKLESRQAAGLVKRQPMQKQKEEDKPIIPDFNQAEKTMKIRQQDIMTKGADEVLKSPVEARKEQKATVIIENKDTTVKDLANEIADNSLLSTPNFDEDRRKEVKLEPKDEVKQEIEKKVRRRRMTETEVV